MTMSIRTKLGELLFTAAHGRVARSDIESYLRGAGELDSEAARLMADIEKPQREAEARMEALRFVGWDNLLPVLDFLLEKQPVPHDISIRAMQEKGATHRNLGTNLYLNDEHARVLGVLATRLGMAGGRLVNLLIWEFAQMLLANEQRMEEKSASPAAE